MDDSAGVVRRWPHIANPRQTPERRRGIALKRRLVKAVLFSVFAFGDPVRDLIAPRLLG